MVVTRGKQSPQVASAHSSKELHGCTEETWDMPFDPKNALNASDRDYLKTLDPEAILSKCSHQLVRISCPCGVNLKARECTECNFYLCGSDCSAMKRSSKGATGSELCSTGACVSRRELKKMGSGWFATTGGFYIPCRNLKEKEALKQFSQVVLKSFDAFEGTKPK